MYCINDFIKSIRKAVIKAAAAGFILIFINGIPIVLAAGQDSSNDAVMENPGLLPTNPFYFIKSWFRTAQRAVILNPIRKAELELDILNEKLAEISRLYDILDRDSEAIRDAISLYNESLVRFQSYVNAIKDKSRDSQTSKLLDKALEIIVRHYAIFNGLENRSNFRVRESLEQAQDKLVETTANLFSRLDSQDNFQNRLEKLLDRQSDLTQLLTFGEFLNDLDDKTVLDSSIKDGLLRVRGGALMEIQAALEIARIGNSLAAVWESLAGSRTRHIAILDSLRDLAADSDLKNELSIIRQHLFDLAKDEKSISKPAAEKVIRLARAATQLLREKIRNLDIKSNALNVLVARAEFNATQAEISFGVGQYGEAFGQASASLAAAKNALSQIGNFSVDRELRKLKSQYDDLFKIVKDNGLTAEQFPDLFSSFSNAEKSLIRVSDLASAKNYSFDRVSDAFREAELSVARADRLVSDLLKELQEKTESKKSGQPLIQRVLPASADREKEIRKEAIEEIKKSSGNQ